jgi:hypothetical protein
MHIALFIEDLRHADLFSQNSRNCHVFLTSSCDVDSTALPEFSRVQGSGFRDQFASAESNCRRDWPACNLGSLTLLIRSPRLQPRPTLTSCEKSANHETEKLIPDP